MTDLFDYVRARHPDAPWEAGGGVLLTKKTKAAAAAAKNSGGDQDEDDNDHYDNKGHRVSQFTFPAYMQISAYKPNMICASSARLWPIFTLL